MGQFSFVDVGHFITGANTLLDEASTDGGNSIVKSIFFDAGPIQESYMKWQMENFILQSSIDELVEEEGRIWSEVIMNEVGDFSLSIKLALLHLNHEGTQDVEPKILVGWIDEDRENIEQLLPENIEGNERLNTLLERRRELRNYVVSKRRERDQLRQNFLCQEIVWKRYVNIFQTPDYYLNSLEIHMIALLFNKWITMIHYNQLKEVVRSENDFNTKDSEEDHIYIFHEGDHFERCVLD